MLSLGISHRPLKSAMRNSIKDSDISNLAQGLKLDLTKFKNPEDGFAQVLRRSGKQSTGHNKRLIE